MGNVTTYTVGGSIRNRSANMRGRNAAREWFAYDETETPKHETRNTKTRNAETGPVSGFAR
jgi:hypothetical protein